MSTGRTDQSQASDNYIKLKPNLIVKNSIYFNNKIFFFQANFSPNTKNIFATYFHDANRICFSISYTCSLQESSEFWYRLGKMLSLLCETESNRVQQDVLHILHWNCIWDKKKVQRKNWNWTPTLNICRGKRYWQLYIHVVDDKNKINNNSSDCQ